jgi:hypothetical protein
MVAALDKLLAQSLANMIREKLGQKTSDKIEDRLRQRYGFGLVDSIKEFHTLDATLREFFGQGADAVEADFKDTLISLSRGSKGRQWITIENIELAEQIFEVYGDKENRMILNYAYETPAVILDILEKTGIPKSSGYRLINQLVEDGFLTEQGFAETSDGKKVSKYTALFERTRIETFTQGLIVQVLLKENILEESQIVKILVRGPGKA